jgi:hypothetical protein
MLLINLLVFVTEETEECLANTCALHRQEPAFVVDDTLEGSGPLELGDHRYHFPRYLVAMVVIFWSVWPF